MAAPAQDSIAAPVFRELHRRPLEVAAVLLKLGFEAGKKREGVGRRAGESCEDAFVVESPDLAGALFDDRLAERDLAVAGQHSVVAVANRKNRGALKHRLKRSLSVAKKQCQEIGTEKRSKMP